MQNDEFKYNSKIILKNKLGYKENNLENFLQSLEYNTKAKKIIQKI